MGNLQPAHQIGPSERRHRAPKTPFEQQNNKEQIKTQTYESGKSNKTLAI